MIRASPAISSAVSPFIRRPIANAAICDGVASPSTMSSMAAAASVSRSERPSTTLTIISLMAIIGYLPAGIERRRRRPASPVDAATTSRKFWSRILPPSVKIDSGWNWTPYSGSSRWRRPMTSAVCRLGVDDQAVGQGARGRPPASGSGRPGTGSACPRRGRHRRGGSCEVLPCSSSGALTILAPYAAAMAWWPRQTPRIGSLPTNRSMTAMQTPASSGRARARREHDAVGLHRLDVLDGQASLRRTSTSAPSSQRYWYRL